MIQQSANTVYHLNRGGTAMLALAVIALLLAVSACSGDKATSEAEPYPPPNPLLYELANADGEVEGWLIGTIHALPEGVSWRTPAIEQAVSDADLLMVEVAELGASGDVARSFAKLAHTPGLPPVEERIAPTLRPDFRAMLARSNVPQSNWRDAEDWAAAVMLAQVDAPGEPRYGVDRALIGDFEGRDIQGFETAQGQLDIFDQLDDDDQRALLEGTIEEWAKSRSRPGKLLRAWIAGDTKTLERATTEGIMADPELRAALLVNRNEDWIGPLLAVLGTKRRPFVAVGAAHIVGADGLPTLLKKHGYTAKRITNR